MMTDKGDVISRPTVRPARKLAVASVGGAAATALLWALDALGITGYKTRERASARR
jgi:hypothetical protein